MFFYNYFSFFKLTNIFSGFSELCLFVVIITLNIIIDGNIFTPYNIMNRPFHHP